MHGPVFLALECLDFKFALDDHAQRGALHTPGRKPGADFAPQQWRQVETDQIIKRAPRLLGIYQRLGNFARVCDRFSHRRLGDLIEHHALQVLSLHAALGLEQLGDMPGDSLTLAVRVGSQIDVVCRCGGLGDRVHVLAVARDGFVFHRKLVLGIDRAGLRDQVAHMPVRGKNLEILAQIFLQRLGLCR